MDLIVQIQSLFLSFLYGIFFALTFNIFYRFIFTRFIFINIIVDILYSLFIFGLYFYLLYIVNNGIFHLYFLFMLFIGFFIYCKLFVKLRIK